MIADYSLAVGDSMDFPEWGVPLVLDSIFYHTTLAPPKYFSFGNNWGGYYEGIGSSTYGVFPNCYGLGTVLLSHQILYACHATSAESRIIELYPNPVKDHLFLKNIQRYLDMDIPVSYIIINMMGAIEMQGNISSSAPSINLDRVSGGMHLLKLVSNNELIFQQKFIRL
ncbi:MAG TPA: T9SS type A sorting domain-containing protein [Saprospiraceae bacterium]|nr:T9SS type A sorting domain-containing protein [Saprospiraceae bacterium]HMQ85474.1 T9SS type A sorting domain-containing protein [Saprospiraceae bacterium]